MYKHREYVEYSPKGNSVNMAPILDYEISVLYLYRRVCNHLYLL